MIKNTSFVDPFWGNGASAAPPGEGLAKHWNWLKPHVGNTHPGAVMPFGWVSVLPYSGAYPTGYGIYGFACEGEPPQVSDCPAAWGLTHFHHSGTGYVGEFYNYILVTPSSFGREIRDISELTGEYAEPGYFSGKLVDYAVDFESVCGKYAAFHRFRFAGDRGKVRVDITRQGLGIDIGEYCEKIGIFHGHSTEKGTYSGYINGQGVEIFYAVNCGGEIRRQRLVNGIIDFEVSGSCAEVILAFSLKSEAEALERLQEAKSAGFDRMRSAAAGAWEELLGKIRLRFADEKDTRLFYSALYHSMVKPCDTGDGFTDFVTMWDIYRTQLPLVMLTAPETAEKIARFMLRYIGEKGFFPCCCMMSVKNAKHDMQATALSIYTLCDAFFHGALGEADYPQIRNAFEKVFASASTAGKSPTHVLDLAGAYRAAAFTARACGDDDSAARWEEKSRMWKSVYDPETGLLTADAEYYEGTWWNYSFRPHTGMAERVDLAGGMADFEKLLDKFFCFDCQDEYDSVRPQTDHRFEAMNNESDMETPAAYLWCGRADKQALIHETIRRNMFLNGVGGCPGNNDSGALSSWYVLSVLGIYPLTGTPYTLLTAPAAEKAQVKLGKAVLTIEVERSGASAIYPAAYEFNGRKFTEPWLLTSQLHQGGVLKFIMKDEPASDSPVPNWL